MNHKRIFILIAFVAFLLTAFGFQISSEFKILFEKAKFTMETKGDLKTAINLFNEIIKKYPSEREYAARSQFLIGQCYEKLGNAEARKAYESVLRDYAEQSRIVNEARARLEALGAQQQISSNRQILAGPDVNTWGTPSPDGRYLSYPDDKKNSLAIYDMKTGESTILTNHSANRDSIWVEGSIWSPDGKQLAYAFNDWFYHTEIHLVNADGTVHRALLKKTDTTATYISIHVEDWSPDGKLILALYCHGYKPSVGAKQVNVAELVVVSVEDGSIRLIKTLDNWKWMHPYPKMFFSPDSRFIAYSSSTEKKGNNCDVFVIAVDGSSEINITQHPADDRVLGWEPNGNRLLFESDRGGSNNLWATQIVSGKPQGFPKLIRNNIAKISPMGLTNNGSLFYYVTGTQVSSIDFFTESNIYFASLDPQTGKIFSQPIAATMNNNGFNHSGSWSPDGKQLLYYSFFGKSGSSPRKYFTLSPETGLEKEVMHQLGADSSLGGSTWFPDGKHLAASVRMPNREDGIYKLEIETGRMMPLVTSKDTLYWAPKVSPDGKILFFESNFGGIYSYDLERKELKLLFQRGKNQYLRNSVLSLNGGHLAFALVTYEPKYSEAMMIMPSSGGEPKSIFRADTFGFFSRSSGIRWSPDGKYIYFVKIAERDSKQELFRISAQGGIPESTGLMVEGLHEFFFRPDGKQIVFCAAVQPKPEIWVIENIFAEARTQPTTVTGLVTRRVLEDATKIGEALTADGKYIRSLDENTGDILQFEISSGDTTRIKNKSKWGEKEKSFQDIVFSPDGKQIAYNIEVFDPGIKCWGYPLQIRNLDGSNLRTLYSEKGSYYLRLLDWSPDAGSILVFISHTNVTELAVISTMDGSLRILKRISPGWPVLQSARFSPDGRFVALNEMREGNPPHSDLLLIDSNGQNEVVIAGHPAEDQLVDWTPDGGSIIFLSDRSGTLDIWTVNLTGGKQKVEPVLLKKDFGCDSGVIGFAPDGSLYYKTHTSLGQLFNGSLDLVTGKVIVPPAPVKTRYAGPPSQLKWSPDGKNLAYISRWSSMRPGNNILTIRSAATGEEHFLTPRLRFVNQISWAPDGNSIIALGLTETEQGIYRIDIETSRITKLANDGVFPRLCPDEKTLLFIKGGPIITKRNLETGEESEIVKIKGLDYDLSPDGREIVYQNDVDGIIKIISINGGSSRELFSDLTTKLSFLKWTRDGRYILAKAGTEIWRIPAQGGTALKLDFTVPKMVSLTLHPDVAIPKMASFALQPDNRNFWVSVNEESKSELWVMENFLPKEKK